MAELTNELITLLYSRHVTRQDADVGDSPDLLPDSLMTLSPLEDEIEADDDEAETDEDLLDSVSQDSDDDDVRYVINDEEDEGEHVVVVMFHLRSFMLLCHLPDYLGVSSSLSDG